MSAYGVSFRDLADGRAPSEDLAGYRVVRAGDLVVNKLWARFGAYGVSAVDGIISPAYWVLTVDRTCLDPRYLHYLLRSAPYLAEIRRLSRNLPPNGYDLSWQQFRTVQLPLLPIEEQRRMADFLDDQVALLERATHLRRRQAQVVEKAGQSRISELLAPVNYGNDGVPGLPWLARSAAPLTKLGYVCRLQSGLTVDAQRQGSREYPYLRVANVQAERVDLTEVKTVRVDPQLAERVMLRTGDVLMSEGGDLDKLGRGTTWEGQIRECLHQNHVFALRPDPKRLLPAYLAALTRTDHARRYFESTGVKTTNLASTNSTKILAFRVPLPSVAVQRQLLAEIDSADQFRLRLLASCARSESLLQERKQALITAAVTGEFDVTTTASARSVA